MDSVACKAQVGALPVRRKNGTYEVLLITTRDAGRWIIPKGWPMKGRKDHRAAAREALEEAGVRGRPHAHPMGAYTYDKRIDGGEVPIRVMVYLLEVQEELEGWPEKDERTRQWMAPARAAELVTEPGLAEILLRLNAMPTLVEPDSHAVRVVRPA